MRFIQTMLIFTLLLRLGVISVTAQTWEAPADQKKVVAPFLFTPEMQKSGEQLYMKNCQSCHGIPGKDNWARLTPPPGDLALEKVQKQPDGEWFYKITAGKTPMPEFRNILKEEERWHVIAWLRTFNPKYVQPDPAAQGDFAGRVIALALKYDESSKRLVVNATEKLKDGSNVPAGGVEVMIFAKRYFGNMQLGDMKTTTPGGEASFEFPADLPGNKEGMVDLMATVNDPKGQMRTTPASATLAIGVPTDRPGLTETRAWWSTRDKAPVWIIVTYTGAVIIVWAFIFYILFTMMKIRKAGNA